MADDTLGTVVRNIRAHPAVRPTAGRVCVLNGQRTVADGRGLIRGVTPKMAPGALGGDSQNPRPLWISRRGCGVASHLRM